MAPFDLHVPSAQRTWLLRQGLMSGQLTSSTTQSPLWHRIIPVSGHFVVGLFGHDDSVLEHNPPSHLTGALAGHPHTPPVAALQIEALLTQVPSLHLVSPLWQPFGLPLSGVVALLPKPGQLS